MALHIIATMFPKPHFICHAKPMHTKITYSKLASFNSRLQNGVRKLKNLLEGKAT